MRIQNYGKSKNKAIRIPVLLKFGLYVNCHVFDINIPTVDILQQA
ncbi:hypothetical protein SLEP1_g39022 [Rubroshorea leprosula]|uniref:Uncharacterized protein n=1 Tax=Rubroshorea leprosula TaxID=152421 RepID=A0AAV5KZZ9_9ROSI|nr:hypothetical protein SLEP1_g39022 [Rubroshorea leprosula]